MAKLKGKQTAGRMALKSKVVKGKKPPLKRKIPSRSESGKNGRGKDKKVKKSGQVILTSNTSQEKKMVTHLERKCLKTPKEIIRLEPIDKMRLGKKVKRKSTFTKEERRPVRNISVKNKVVLLRRKRKELNSKLDLETQNNCFKRMKYSMRKQNVSRSGLKKLASAARKQNLLDEIRNDPAKCYVENDGSEMSLQKVSEAVKALLHIIEDKDTKLFSDESKDIYLQITSFKVPITSPREIRVVLPHSLLPSPPDVCLFTSDLEKGKRVDHEPTLEHYKNLLGEKGVNQITEIVTVRQLKTEYDQYELKRALCSRFDIFLSDAKVSGHITHLLGKTFYDRKKIPVPINLNAVNLKERVEKALHKSSFRVSGKGTIFSLKVAHTFLTPEQIQENIMSSINALHECFPGGWDNILQLMIKGGKSIPVPFYLSTVKDNNVYPHIVKSLRPKAAKNAFGELPGSGMVKVTPKGKIFIVKKEEEDEYEEEVNKTERETQRERVQEKWLRKRKAKGHQSKEEDDIDEEDLIQFAKHSRLQSEENEKELCGESEDAMEEGDEAYRNEDVEKYDDSDDEDNNDNDSANHDQVTKIDMNREESIDTMESKYLRNWVMTRSVEEEEKGDEKQKETIQQKKKRKRKTGIKQKHSDNNEKKKGKSNKPQK